MTISVKVSCNGKYKCPVSYEQGTGETVELLLDGSKTAPQPDETNIPYYHGSDNILSIQIGPEEKVDEETDSSPSSTT
jgi:hypothetical protein